MKDEFYQIRRNELVSVLVLFYYSEAGQPETIIHSYFCDFSVRFFVAACRGEKRAEHERKAVDLSSLHSPTVTSCGHEPQSVCTVGSVIWEWGPLPKEAGFLYFNVSDFDFF